MRIINYHNLKKKAAPAKTGAANNIISKFDHASLRFKGDLRPLETSKAKKRRISESFFDNFCNGIGIDIGCGSDPLTPDCDCWEKVNGDATYMTDIPNECYDYVYSSHCLEHLNDPHAGIKNWFRILKKGGYLLIYIPHRDLYEKKKTLPSTRNPSHKKFYLPYHEPPDTIGLKKLIEESINDYEILYVKTCDDISKDEYSIECVVRKSNSHETKDINKKNISKKESSMPKICLTYVTNSRYDIVYTSVKTMEKYDEINNIIVLYAGEFPPKEIGELSKNKKIKEYHKYFGSGFDKSLNEGGWDQISARNYLLQLSDENDSDWVICCDDDEFFVLENMFNHYDYEIFNNYDMVAFQMYHFVDLHKYVYYESGLKCRRGVLLFDPHIRMWRKNLNAEWGINPRIRATNITRHPEIKKLGWENEKLLICDQMVHIHVHDFECVKGNRGYDPSQLVKYDLNIFPKEYLEFFSKYDLL